MNRLCATALAFAFLFCQGLRPATAAGDPLELDAILSLTGRYAFLGSAEAVSLRTLETVVNQQGGVRGQPIHFVIADDGSDASTGLQLANGIIAKHVAVIFGPTYLGTCAAMLPIVRASGPVTYCFAPTIHPPPGSYMFSAGAASSDQAVASLVYAQARGWYRLAAIAPADATGQDIGGQFDALIASGRFPKLSIVDREKFTPSDVTVAAQIAKIKSFKPDAILVQTVGASTGTVLRGIQEVGLDVPVISNLGNLLHAQLDQYASILPREIYFTSPRFIARDVSGKGPVRDAQLVFYKAFNAQGIDPDVGHNTPWDASMILIDALRHLGPNATATQVRDYLEALHGYAGTDGIYDYRGGDQRGVGLTSIVMARWNPAKKTWETVSAPGGKPLSGNER
jgi:branched-chain amino acid transport system substrate-binding protein